MQGHHSNTALADMNPDTVLITPLDEHAQSLPGSLSSFDIGSNGLAVNATATVARTAYLGIQPVWVMAKHDGKVIAFHGLARQTRPSRVELTGLSAPLEEHRRAFPRARVSVRCQVHRRGKDVQDPWYAGTVVDLSRRSCRVEAASGQILDKGTYVELAVSLDGHDLTLPALVQRSEPRAGHMVLGFVSLSPQTAASIDRLVLSRLVPQDPSVG